MYKVVLKENGEKKIIKNTFMHKESQCNPMGTTNNAIIPNTMNFEIFRLNHMKLPFCRS